MGTELTRFDLTRQALIMGRPPSRRDFPYADIGSRIRTAREARGLSQTEIAELLGYQYQSGYQKIESGQQPPSVDVLRRLHMVLGLTPNELLLGDAEDILDDIPDDVTEEDVARLKAAALAEAALLRKEEAEVRSGKFAQRLASEQRAKITKPVKRPPGVPPLRVEEPTPALRRKHK